MNLFDTIGQKFKDDPDLKDRLTIGLQGMTMNPNQGLIDLAKGNIAQRQKQGLINQQANKTIDFLRAKGVDEATLKSLEGNPQMLMAYASELMKKKFAKPVADTTSVREFNFAKTQGYEGDYTQWMKEQATLKGGNKLTEGESNKTGYYSRAREANSILNRLDSLGTDQAQNIAKSVPFIGNYFLDPDFQKMSQAQENFLYAILRPESGAVIGPDEISTYGKVYFPLPGDSAQVIEQKRQARELAVEGLRIASGRGADKLDNKVDPQATTTKRGSTITGGFN